MLYGIIVDQKIIAKRKYYVIFCGLVSSAMMVVVANGVFDDAKHTAAVLFIGNMASAFLDVTMESLVIEQARKDPENGQ